MSLFRAEKPLYPANAVKEQSPQTQREGPITMYVCQRYVNTIDLYGTLKSGYGVFSHMTCPTMLFFSMPQSNLVYMCCTRREETLGQVSALVTYGYGHMQRGVTRNPSNNDPPPTPWDPVKQKQARGFLRSAMSVCRYSISKKKEGKKECYLAAIWLGLMEMKLTVTVTQ